MDKPTVHFLSVAVRRGRTGRVDGKDIALILGMASRSRSRPAAAAPSEASRHLLEFVDTTSNRALFAGVTQGIARLREPGLASVKMVEACVMTSDYHKRFYPLATLFAGLVFTVAWIGLVGYGLLVLMD